MIPTVLFILLFCSLIVHWLMHFTSPTHFKLNFSPAPNMELQDWLLKIYFSAGKDLVCKVQDFYKFHSGNMMFRVRIQHISADCRKFTFKSSDVFHYSVGNAGSSCSGIQSQVH